ncbi:MAG: hypothetical protein HQ542_01475 [Bacteroidia bacterium]|nr:hypothetical protein [Bacteroidia bacterium]
MKVFLSLIICFFIFQQNLLSQDLIILRNGDELEVHVTEISSGNIKFKKDTTSSEATHSLPTSNVFMIKFNNGVKQIFEPENTQSTDMISVENKNLDGNSLIQKSNNFKFVDERDKDEYKIVPIGEQWWMAENLRFQTEKSRCYKDKEDLYIECGQFYSYEDALIACPDGWHLPSDDEWISLEIAAGMFARHAKEMGWRGTPPGQAPALLLGGETRLNLSMCGRFLYITSDNAYWSGNSRHAYYWTKTRYKDNTILIRHLKDRLSIERCEIHEKSYLPIRCVKN